MGQKISEMTLATTLTGVGFIPVVQGGLNKKITESQTQPFVDVRWYGAIADFNTGTEVGTDNSDAFQDAIDAQFALGGGEVYIPAGNYLINSQIDLKAKVVLRGAGTELTKLYCGTDSINLLSAKSVWAGGFGVEYLTLTTLKNNVNGLAIYDCWQVYLSYVRFRGLLHGIYLDSENADPYAASSIVHGRFLGLIFDENAGASLYVTTLGATWSVQMMSCRFEVTYDAHIEMISSTAPGVLKGMIGFYTCIFESSRARKPLNFGKATNIRFYDCHFEYNGADITNGTVYDIFFDEGSKSISFMNCLWGNNPYNESVRKYHIYLSDHISNVTIQGSEYYMQSTVLTAVHVGAGCQGITLINNNYGWNVTNGSNLFLELLSPVTRINDGSNILQKGFIEDNINAFIVTTNATPAKLFTYTLPYVNMIVYVIVDVVATTNTAGNKAGYTRKALLYSDGMGVSVVGSIDTATTIETDAAWDCTISTTGTDQIDVLVTGANGTAITWVGSVKIVTNVHDRE